MSVDAGHGRDYLREIDAHDVTHARLFRERLFIASPLNDYPGSCGGSVYIIPAKCRRFLVRRVLPRGFSAALSKRPREKAARAAPRCIAALFIRLLITGSSFNPATAGGRLDRAPTKVPSIDFLGTRNEFPQSLNVFSEKFPFRRRDISAYSIFVKLKFSRGINIYI